MAVMWVYIVDDKAVERAMALFVGLGCPIGTKSLKRR